MFVYQMVYLQYIFLNVLVVPSQMVNVVCFFCGELKESREFTIVSQTTQHLGIVQITKLSGLHTLKGLTWYLTTL